MPTTKLNLPLIDGTNTADVVRDMNALANAVDSKAGASDGLATLDATGKVPASQLNVSAPADATTSTKGVVQLSNSTTSTSEVLAATPKAVKDAKDGLSNQIGILSGDLSTHTTNTSNPHSVTKTQVGLGSVENYAVATQAEAQAGTVTNKYMTPQRTKQAIDSQTGDRSTLKTTAKTTLVAAINELFTFANDGKTKWSSVIGSPLVSTDTFAQMETKTQTIKNTLATNLTAKGQSSVGTETLTALAGKVANITQNPFASYSVTSKVGNTTGLVGINSDGETYTNSSGTVSRRNYGGTVLETFPSKGGVVWFSEDRWCGRPSTNTPVIYDPNNTIIHTTAGGSYGVDQSDFKLDYLSFNGEYAFNFPTSYNQRIYYKSKSGSTKSLDWPWFPTMYPTCVYNKSTQSGAIIGLGHDQYGEVREMFYQRGNTISSTELRGLDLFLFVPFKV